MIYDHSWCLLQTLDLLLLVLYSVFRHIFIVTEWSVQASIKSFRLWPSTAAISVWKDVTGVWLCLISQEFLTTFSFFLLKAVMIISLPCKFPWCISPLTRQIIVFFDLHAICGTLVSSIRYITCGFFSFSSLFWCQSTILSKFCSMLNIFFK